MGHKQEVRQSRESDYRVVWVFLWDFSAKIKTELKLWSHPLTACRFNLDSELKDTCRLRYGRTGEMKRRSLWTRSTRPWCRVDRLDSRVDGKEPWKREKKVQIQRLKSKTANSNTHKEKLNHQLIFSSNSFQTPPAGYITSFLLRLTFIQIFKIMTWFV